MTCTHINQITDKISDLFEKLRNESSFLYEKEGPYVNRRDIDDCISSVNVSNGVSSHIAAVETIQKLMGRIMEIDTFTLNTIKGRVIADYAIEILNLIKECNCSSEAGNRANNLHNDYNKLVNDYNSLQDRHRKVKLLKDFVIGNKG